MRLFPLAALPLIFLVGCGKTESTLAGGKPVTHWVEELRTNPDAKMRKEAAFKLGNVGPTDPTALTALLEGLKDRDAVVRREAVQAIVKFGPAALDAVPALTELHQHDRDPKVRDFASKALEKIQAKG